MAIKKDIQSPKKGMNRNTNPFELSKEEYTFALNANIFDEHGNGQIIIQNEPSNVKCSNFKEGYKVIGHKYDINADRTYFFLHNPTELISEIGYINSFYDNVGLVPTEVEQDGMIVVELEAPLEEITQTAYCDYTTVISDYCELTSETTDAFGFRLEYPIKELNIHIKDEKAGKTIYFTDNLNPQRYINLDDIQSYFQDKDECTGEITQTCIQVDKMRIFKLHNKPCLRPRVIQEGGFLKAGMYESIIAYCTISGDELTDYYALTNPTPIWDKGNNILDQTNLDYQTSKAISIDVFDLDQKFDYYRIAVIYRSGLDGAVTIFENGIYPINQERVIISSSQTRARKITLADIINRRPFYEKARGLAVGKSLYQYGLTAHREINLQPIVNLLGAFVRWSTVQAMEDIYEDGVDVSNYRAYMRDEVYPLSIKFIEDGGYEYPLFPFIARPPKDFEVDEVNTAAFPEDLNTKSVLAYNAECTENSRTKRWQFENTAEILGRCDTAAFPGLSTETVERDEFKECLVEDEEGNPLVVDTIVSSEIAIYTNGLSLVDYINLNLSQLKDSTDSNGADITQILNTTYAGDCDPDFGFNCEEPELVSETIIAISVETEETIEGAVSYTDYERVAAPVTCRSLRVCTAIEDEAGDCTEGGYIQDTDFRDDYMHPSQVIYEKAIAISSTTCASAAAIPTFSTPQSDNNQYFQYLGNNNPSPNSILDTTAPVTAFDNEFTGFLGKNALWYRFDFFGTTNPWIVELSAVFCNTTDDNTSDRLRITVFQGSCGSLVEVPAYTKIIEDTALVNDTNKFLVLDPTDFTSPVVYIVVDTPLEREIDLSIELTSTQRDLTLFGSSGTLIVTIGAFNYSVAYNMDLPTTASDFVTDHASDILTNNNITVSATLGVLSFIATTPAFAYNEEAISLTTSLADLSGTLAYVTTGSIDVVIDGQTYTEPFDTDFTTTASNFATSFATDIQNNHGGFVGSTTDKIILYLPYEIWTTVYSSNNTGTLVGKGVEVERFRNRLKTPCGCYSIKQQLAQPVKKIVYTNLTFGKRQRYKATCEYSLPVLAGCNVVPYEYGLFSYWESIERYPCNEELYDSSKLKIPVERIPEDYREEFEEYYVNTQSAGIYQLNTEANFMDKGIRHYKFPDSIKVPFMSYDDGVSPSQDPGAFKKSVVYPIGFQIDNEIINAFLDVAVDNKLLTQAERSRIRRYEIFRGDRRTDRSIIAKGLLYDMYRYKHRPTDDDYVYYSNYPLNQLGTDSYNGGVPHPYSSTANLKYTFHSPETHFYKPTIPGEIKVEGYQYGSAASYFDEVRDHPTYVLLTDEAQKRARDIARLEYGLEVFTQLSGIVGQGEGIIRIILGVAFVGAGVYFMGAVKIAQYKQQWLDTFTNLGKPQNFAYYGVTVGHYGLFKKNSVENSTLRGIATSGYISAGRWSIADEQNNISLDINNFDREDSVFISLGKETSPAYPVFYPSEYTNYDTTRSVGWDGVSKSPRLASKTASPYASLKQYVPGQYGTINSIQWLHTGYCGKLTDENSCDGIFGGDIYISRFSLKRKFPFFTTNAYGQAPLTPYKYSDYFNVNPHLVPGDPITNRFFIDYLINDDTASGFNNSLILQIGQALGLSNEVIDNISGMIETFKQTVFLQVFPNNISKFKLDKCATNDASITFLKFYEKPPCKFYLFSYGIPYFLVESEVNCNYRYARPRPEDNFYPNVGDIIEWTQEKNVPIRTPNTYFYNSIYSSVGSLYPWRMLPVNYTKEFYDKLNDLTNSVIYSKEDASETDITDPWLLYKALDFYDFPKAYGRLIILDQIESEQMLGIFQNGMTLFGAIDIMRDRLTPETGNLGSGGIFAGRNINFNKTDLGYAGTQHAMKISCEFGHFWCDAKRGKVFNMQPGAGGMEEITGECEKWFKENLPFKIIKTVPGMTDLDVDNNFKGLGIAMGWDDRLKRVFITKKDYKALRNVCFFDGIFHDTTGYEDVIEQWEQLGYTYEGVEDCKHKFTIEENDEIIIRYVETQVIELTNTEYFEDCSFTIAYSPLIKSWISYYSFKPDYYVAYNDYFQTGLNFSADDTELGLWSHVSFLSSYQVYYGKLYPFTIEYPIPTNFTNSLLHHVEYFLDVRKYYNKYDYTDIYGIGFNKAVVYNSHQNSGQIELVHHEENNLRQGLDYPQFNTNFVSILQSNIHDRWTFNTFNNRIVNPRNGLPLWLFDCAQVEKELDHRLLDYSSRILDYLRGDYFLVRLTNDKESRYKFLTRFNLDEREYYEQ
jgi:hypothetical protein